MRLVTFSSKGDGDPVAVNPKNVNVVRPDIKDPKCTYIGFGHDDYVIVDERWGSVITMLTDEPT